MADPNYLELLAAEVLDVSVDASDQTIEERHTELVREVHPDVSDAPDANERFKAVDTAKDILVGDFSFEDSDARMTAENVMERLFDDDELGEISERTDDVGGYTGTAEKRTNPTGFNMSDFEGMGTEERSQTIKTVSLGVETLLVFQGVNTLYRRGYSKDDFFMDINSYIDSEDPESLSYSDYYKATKDSLRDDVTRSVFVESIKSQEEKLENEYGQGTDIKEIARIIAYFIVQGGVDIGFGERFIQSGRFGRDERFSRGRTSDGRFGRDDRFGR